VTANPQKGPKKALFEGKIAQIRAILGLFWGPKFRFSPRCDIKTLSRSEIFYSGMPDLVELYLKSQHPTPTPLYRKLIFVFRSGCAAGLHRTDTLFLTFFDIFAKTRHKAATTPQTLLLAMNIDSRGSKFTGFNKKDFLVKKLSSSKVATQTTKKAPPGRHFGTLIFGVCGHFGPKNESCRGGLRGLYFFLGCPSIGYRRI